MSDFEGNNDDRGLEEGYEEENLESIANENSNQIEDLEQSNEVEDFTKTYQNMDLARPRKTIPFLTKFEKARIIGKRAMQISKGAPPLVNVDKLENPVDIALKELQERKIPYIIRRALPNGVVEDWRVDELRFN